MAKLAPCLRQCANEAAPGFPRRGSSDGWLGDTAHSKRKSDHNADERGIVHAVDLDKDGLAKPRDALLAIVIADFRTEYVIDRGFIYSRAFGFRKRTYTGANGHHEHMHISGRHGAIYENDTRPWFKSGSQSPIPQEEEEMFLFSVKSTNDTKNGIWFHPGGGKALHVPTGKDIDGLKKAGIKDAGELSEDFLLRFERVHPGTKLPG